MSIFGIHICMDEIRQLWPVALFIVPAFAFVKGCIHSFCKRHKKVDGCS